MTRLRLFDLVNSEFPRIMGRCATDIPGIASDGNRCQERLIYAEEANEEGWYGSWAEMVFAVNRRHPIITAPRGVSRIEAIDTCGHPTPLQNQFFEYLTFGDGRMPHTDRWRNQWEWWQRKQGYTRNNSALMEDLSSPPQFIQIFAAPQDCQPISPAGIPPRVLVQGISNGTKVYTQDNGQTVEGEFVVLAEPYAMTVNQYQIITGIQKDPTQQAVQFFQSDPQWGIAEPILTMEPNELTAWYPRYYIHELPRNCCPAVRPIQVNPPPPTCPIPTCGCPYERREYVQVTALAKLDFLPVVALTDYLIIQSLEALIYEGQSMRQDRMDEASTAAKAAQYHANAIRVLRGQSISDVGKNNVAVNFSPFGRGRINRRVNLTMR